MKHAFLIIAHHDFEVLQTLINLIDDVRNDIFIHIDKKVKDIPEFSAKYSKVFLVNDDNRIDVRWGNVSQIESELALFELARNKGLYEYYHLISGVHLPLVNQDEFHSYFKSISGKQVFSPIIYSDYELQQKGNRLNFFMRFFQGSRIAQISWRLGVMAQTFLGFRINKDRQFIKASNWLSITNEVVNLLLDQKNDILKRYRYSMCGDELFIPTELKYSGKEWEILYSEKYLFHEIGVANATFLTEEDVEKAISLNYLFGRKFSSNNIKIVNQVVENVMSK